MNLNRLGLSGYQDRNFFVDRSDRRLANIQSIVEDDFEQASGEVLAEQKERVSESKLSKLSQSQKQALEFKHQSSHDSQRIFFAESEESESPVKIRLP